MEPIRSIAEIPFVEKGVLDLLNLAEHRDDPDHEYYLYGYSRIDRVYLFQADSPEPLPVVRDALLLGLHSADEGEVLPDDVELEFFAEEVEDDYSVTVLLSDFLRDWLPRISSDERAIVLVMCNPHRATITRPAIAAGTPMYYARGDVESWLDEIDGQPYIHLVAESWSTAD